MKFTIASLVALLSVSVAAQNTGNIPTCALSCFAKAVVASGCDATDTTCQCGKGKDAITKSVTSCIASTNPCSASDLAKIQPAADELCASAGGSSSSGSASGSASTTGSAASASGSGSSSARTTASGSSTTGTASSGSQTSSSSAAAETTGAGSRITVGGLGLAEVVIAAGVFAL